MMLLFGKTALQLRCSKITYAVLSNLLYVHDQPLIGIYRLQNYTEYVGRKSTFRLLNRGSAKALDKVAELDGMTTVSSIFKPLLCDINMLKFSI